MKGQSGHNTGSRRASLVLASLLLIAPDARASRDNDGAFHGNERPVLTVARRVGAIVIDGELDDAGWSGAARASHFSEFYPGDRSRPPVETEAMVVHDDEKLYVAFIAHDDPRALRASLRDRDEILSDDYVAMYLDTYGKAEWVYGFFVNPYGVQADTRWTHRGYDRSFDVLFESKAKITPAGYQVEMAIPFSGLRFPSRERQTWRATFWRNHPRQTARAYSWAAIERGTCYPCNYGVLEGIEGVKPGESWRLMPSVIGSQAGRLRDRSRPESGFDEGPLNGDASLNVRHDFGPSLGVDAALNPDFSQVESDPAQIDVNTTIALSYAERRPFFLEGAELFQTFLPTVYTRSINDPILALKGIGHRGRHSFGYIAARDEHTPIIIPLQERSIVATGGRSTSNILRWRGSVGSDSFLGGLVTDRRLESGGSGSLAGIDGAFRFRKNYQLRWQLLTSRTEEPVDPSLAAQERGVRFDRDAHTVSLDGESFWGHAGVVGLRREGKRFIGDLEYSAISPGFRADSGFVPRNDVRQTLLSAEYAFFPKRRILDVITPTLRASHSSNFLGERKYQSIVPGLRLLFKSQTSLGISYAREAERFRGTDFDDLHLWQLRASSSFIHEVNLSGDVSWGRSIARNATPVSAGDSLVANLGVTLKPTRHLMIQPDVAYSRLRDPRTGSTLFEGHVLRARVKYQFTRPLQLRVVAQRNSFSKSVTVDPLLSYKLNPFTIFYAGSTQTHREFDEVGWTRSSRQFFCKLQYLFQW